MSHNKNSLILINGKIITLDNNDNVYSGLVIENNVIRYVGDSDECLKYRKNQSTIIDLEGKSVIPGLIESHCHPINYAKMFIQIDCTSASVGSIEDIKRKVKEEVKHKPNGEWIIGRGWEEDQLKERRAPTRWDLDEVSPNHPVILKRACGHVSVANSAALRSANLLDQNREQLDIGVAICSKSNELTGILEEKAQELLHVPEPSVDELEGALIIAQDKLSSLGITTVHDMSTQNKELTVYQKIINDNKSKLRYRTWLWAVPSLYEPGLINEATALGIRSGFGNEFLKIEGLKFMLDGSLGGRTAALSESYLNQTNNKGILYEDDLTLLNNVKKTINAHLRVAIHAIGDRAIEQAIRIYEQIDVEGIKMEGLRNRIEHSSIPTECQVKRISQLGVIVGSSASFLYPTGDTYIKNIGKNKTENIFPHNWYEKYNVIAPVNSDFPVIDPNPFKGIYTLVTRKTINETEIGLEHKLTRIDALKAFTKNAAYASFEENVIGTIETGKLADLIVLSDDPLMCDIEMLKDIKVNMTIFNGEIVYQKECK